MGLDLVLFAAKHHGSGDAIVTLVGTLVIAILAIVLIIREASARYDLNLKGGLPYCPRCNRQVSYRRDYCRACGYSFKSYGPTPLSTGQAPTSRRGTMEGQGQKSLRKNQRIHMEDPEPTGHEVRPLSPVISLTDSVTSHKLDLDHEPLIFDASNRLPLDGDLQSLFRQIEANEVHGNERAERTVLNAENAKASQDKRTKPGPLAWYRAQSDLVQAILMGAAFSSPVLLILPFIVPKPLEGRTYPQSGVTVIDSSRGSSSDAKLPSPRLAPNAIVYAKRRGIHYHKEGCPRLAGSDIPMAFRDATRELTPCNQCWSPSVVASANAVTGDQPQRQNLPEPQGKTTAPRSKPEGAGKLIVAAGGAANNVAGPSLQPSVEVPVHDLRPHSILGDVTVTENLTGEPTNPESMVDFGKFAPVPSVVRPPKATYRHSARVHYRDTMKNISPTEAPYGSTPTGIPTYIGPRGGVYHYSPSGRKVYESSRRRRR